MANEEAQKPRRTRREISDDQKYTRQQIQNNGRQTIRSGTTRTSVAFPRDFSPGFCHRLLSKSPNPLPLNYSSIFIDNSVSLQPPPRPPSQSFNAFKCGAKYSSSRHVYDLTQTIMVLHVEQRFSSFCPLHFKDAILRVPSLVGLCRTNGEQHGQFNPAFTRRNLSPVRLIYLFSAPATATVASCRTCPPAFFH